MAVYKDGDKWRVIYRYTNYKGSGSRHRNEDLQPSVKRLHGSEMANEQLANSFRVLAGKELVDYSKKEYA